MAYERNDVIRQFEKTIAEYCGAPYGVAVESCSAALELCCVYLKVGKVVIPKKTYFSVPNVIHKAGGVATYEDLEWEGAYQLKPYPIIDSAMRFKNDSYVAGEFHCLSFHYAKHIPIGRGGMILTDNAIAAEALRILRNDGRQEIPKEKDYVRLGGCNYYMTAETAARGMELFYWRIYGKKNLPDLPMTHMDISYIV